MPFRCSTTLLITARVREAKMQINVFNNNGDNEKKRNRAYLRMHQALIAAQELGDEKMNVVQNILDKIEMKTRLLDQDYKNLGKCQAMQNQNLTYVCIVHYVLCIADFGKDENSSTDNKEQQPPATNTASTTSIPTTERPTKRARRTRHDTFSGLENNHNDSGTAEHVLRSQVSATNQKKTTTGKKKKRKSRQSAQATQREESPPQEEVAIDPDEPTYCLCDQISYGEMIMCDNDLCPIEWFHFSCVSLTTKPKGKWYCPKCRGDRPNVMKPKAQFLRELERYNKEKEEKT